MCMLSVSPYVHGYCLYVSGTASWYESGASRKGGQAALFVQHFQATARDDSQSEPGEGADFFVRHCRGLPPMASQVDGCLVHPGEA